MSGVNNIQENSKEYTPVISNLLPEYTENIIQPGENLCITSRTGMDFIGRRPPVIEDEKNEKMAMIKIRCLMSQKTFNTQKDGVTNPIKIFHVRGPNLIICDSCKNKCHKNNQDIDEYKKKLKNSFICQCDHNKSKTKPKPKTCTFHSETAEAQYCLFCDLICKSFIELRQNKKTVKYKTCDFNEIDKKLILSNKKINHIVLFPKNYKEEIDSLLDCNCSYFYHNDFYYRVIFYKKIINNFYLNPDMNLFQMFYEKRDELLKMLFKPLGNINSIYNREKKDNKFNILNYENFEEKNIYVSSLLDFFNESLTKILPPNTDFFITCDSIDEYINILMEIFDLIDKLVKIKKIEYFYDLKAQLLVFYRKYFINPNIRTIFPSIGLDENTNPIHRILFSQNHQELFTCISVKEKKFKLLLSSIYEMVISSISLYDSCVKMMEEYLYYIEIMILYKFQKEELTFYLKNIDRVIQRLSNAKREKLRPRIEMIAYYILIIYNDYYINDLLFEPENPITNKFSFETASEISNYIINLMFSSKKSINEIDENITSKKAQSVELFDLLLNENDYYLESLKSIYHSKNFTLLGSFLNQNSSAIRNVALEDELKNYVHIIDFFEKLEQYQNGFYRKEYSNEIFFTKSTDLLIDYNKYFEENTVFFKVDSEDEKPQKIAIIEIQVKVFKLGFMQKLIIFLRNFMEISYFIKYKDPSKLNILFSAFFNLITNHFCYNNPFLIALFFNTNMFDNFFPKLSSNSDDEFSENDQMEEEIFGKKIKVYYQFLKSYCKFLTILRNFRYKIDTKHLLQRLLSIVRYKNNIMKLEVPDVNDFLKLFILCIQVNIDKTKDIIQQEISNFLRYILKNSAKVKQELSIHFSRLNGINDLTKKSCIKNENDFNSLFKRIFKLMLKFNTHYFNLVFTNEKMFLNCQINPEHLQGQNIHIVKYYLKCYSTFYFTNFFQIMENYVFSDAKNLDNVNCKDYFVLRNKEQINSYINFLVLSSKGFFKSIDKELEKNNNIIKDFGYLLSFFTNIIALPVFHIIYKILRINDLLITVEDKKITDKEEEIFIQTVITIEQLIRVFLASWKELKDRIIKRHPKDELENDYDKMEILEKYCSDADSFIKVCYNLDDKSEGNLSELLDKPVINLQELLHNFQEFLAMFVTKKGIDKFHLEKENEEFFKKLDNTIKHYEDRKKLFNNNNIVYSIFKDKEKNSTIMKNISENLLTIVTSDLNEIVENKEEKEEVEEDDENEEDKYEDSGLFKDPALVKDSPIKQTVHTKPSVSTNIPKIETDTNTERTKTQENLLKTVDQVQMINQFSKELIYSTINRKKEKGDEIININLEKNLIAYNCILKLFKIDPEFFQIILVNFKKTGLLIKQITEKEIIFLLQPIMNDFYNIQSHFDENVKPSSYHYFSCVIEFLRLFSENFNKMFKSLFFQLKFEYFEPKKYSKGEEEDEDEEDDEEGEENGFPKTIAPHGFVVRKYYFMDLVFKIFSSILRHLNYFQVKKNMVSLFFPEPPGSNYFSELFDTLTEFLVETIQGNSKENFELLNSHFLYFFKNCSQYIDEINIENNEYHVILSKIMKITSEFFQEGEVPIKLKNNVLKKINSMILSDILIYNTKALNLLCNELNFKEGKNLNLLPKELEYIYKEFFLPDIKEIGEDLENQMDYSSFYTQQSENKETTENNENIKKESFDIINNEFKVGDHQNLLTLYTILFSKNKEELTNKPEENQKPLLPIENIAKEEETKTNVEMILERYNKKKLDKLKKDGALGIDQEDDDDEEEEDDDEDEKETKLLLTLFELCTKIYQFFNIIQTFNESSVKFIKYFENAKDEIAESNKFNIYEFVSSYFVKKDKKEISEALILKSEIYEFYSSILKSIEIVHKVKLISDDVDSSKYEHIFKIFKLEMKANDSGITDEDTIIRKIVFLVDPVCLNLKYKEALSLIEKQSFEESATLLTYVVEHIGEFRNIINLRKNIKKSESSEKFKKFEKMEKVNFVYLQVISIIFAIITNFRLATTVSLNVNYELIQESDLFLTVITFLHLIQLGYSVYVYFYIHYIKLSQIIEESKHSSNIEEREYWTRETIFNKVLELAVEEEILYLLWSFTFSLIAFLFNDCRFLYSLLLFPIFQFIPTIQDILHAIKLRAGQFFSAGLIIVVFVFFYSIIAIYFFKDKFVDPDTGVSYIILIKIFSI